VTRLPFALCTLALAAALLAAGAAPGSFQERLEAFRQRNAEARRASGLDYAAAKRKYPTPELSLVSSTPAAGNRETGMLCLEPGRTAELVFDAKLLPGSFVGFQCDALTLLEQKEGGGKLRLKVRVAPDALPTQCDLLAVSPVSGIQTSVPVAHVGGRYTWELQLANGMSSRWQVDATRCEGAYLRGTSTWSQKGKSLGERTVGLAGSGTKWSARVEPTAEEQEVLGAQLQAQSDDASTNAAMEQLTLLSQKMGDECTKLAPAKMQPCFEKYQKLLAPHQQRLQQAGDRMKEAASVRQVGCMELQLAVGTGGSVSGTGSGCGAPGDTEVKGRVVVSAGVP
jgi:hypothetical protein